jgi:hypothetical protein
MAGDLVFVTLLGNCIGFKELTSFLFVDAFILIFIK